MGRNAFRAAGATLIVFLSSTAGRVGIATLGAAVALAGATAADAYGAQTAATPHGGTGTPRSVGVVLATAVPQQFKANSITFASPKQGWVLGAAPCGRRICSDVIGTADGGKTWGLLGVVNAPIARVGDPASPGITEIRFATPKVGWAFGPELFNTTNGGHSWTSMAIPGQGKQVLALASNANEAYAVVSNCAWMTGLCSKQPLSFWRTTTLTGSSWTRIPLDLPIYVAANVAVFGQTVYVVDPQNGTSDKFYASVDGRHFSSRPVPCDKTPDIQLVQAVPTSPTDVALLCVGNPGFSKADKYVYRSTNTGKTDTYAGTMGPYGIQSELSASPSGNLAVASSSDGSFIYVNDTHKTSWTMSVAYSDGGAGWNDIVYVTNQEAWVVYAPPDFFSGIGKLYVTHDGGSTWYLATP